MQLSVICDSTQIEQFVQKTYIICIINITVQYLSFQQKLRTPSVLTIISSLRISSDNSPPQCSLSIYLQRWGLAASLLLLLLLPCPFFLVYSSISSYPCPVFSPSLSRHPVYHLLLLLSSTSSLPSCYPSSSSSCTPISSLLEIP